MLPFKIRSRPLLAMYMVAASVFCLRGICAFFAGDDEYDFTILDPESAHGSPYGGFSRATASRLASLPLRLPHVDDNVEEFEPFYFQVRDFKGRPFTCRAYHEDELEPSSLMDGMFVQPVLKQRRIQHDILDGHSESHDDGPSTQVSDEEMETNTKEEVEKKLAQLEGMCAQFHQGWWSYEWCYEGRVTQFHVSVEDVGNGNQMLAVEDVTSLGEFHERKAVTAPHNQKDSTSPSHRGKQTGMEVVEVFGDGDTCTETGKSRETTAVLTCCTHSGPTKKRGSVIHDGEPVDSNLVYVKSVVESARQICTYTVTVCTPLLCGEETPKKSGTSSPIPASRFANSIEELEKMSISEILDMTFGVKRKKCILFGSGSWWVYELCPGQQVRQYHEVTLLDRVSGATSTAVETEYILGKYDRESLLPKDREWENVVNATTLHTASSSRSKSSSRTALTAHGGNGAYFYEEYTRGDVCDHEDVTDSAIKAGEVGEGFIERSTTVKYGCGAQIDMTVKEDTTCHYVATVSLPALCHHPLFRPPLSKKQVVKCLPEFEE